jgi:hypothetical protein
MTHARSTITYPPELLPSPGADDDVEVIVCDDSGRQTTILTLPSALHPVELTRPLLRRLWQDEIDDR